jgi:hypothetical protein
MLLYHLNIKPLPVTFISIICNHPHHSALYNLEREKVSTYKEIRTEGKKGRKATNRLAESNVDR